VSNTVQPWSASTHILHRISLSAPPNFGRAGVEKYWPAMLQHLLLVEPNDDVAAILADHVRELAEVHRHARFESARAELLTGPVTLIATNLRLRDFNGLHLVHLAATAHVPAKAIVYSDQYEPALAYEVQRAGAFYETRDCLEQALAAYLRGTLPAHDRRNPAVRDRRPGFRGGRRCWDKRPLG
jgi:DNA-binding NtrC family response regulator